MTRSQRNPAFQGDASRQVEFSQFSLDESDPLGRDGACPFAFCQLKGNDTSILHPEHQSFDLCGQSNVEADFLHGASCCG